eukprot:PhF_6_TR33022/c0_g1_i1/m.48670
MIPSKLVSALSQVREIKLRDSAAGDEGITKLVESIEFTRTSLNSHSMLPLYSLDLTNCGLSLVACEALSKLGGGHGSLKETLPNLSVIKLGFNKDLGAAGMQVLEPLLQQMQIVEVPSCGLGGSGVRLCVGMLVRDTCTIQSLDISSNEASNLSGPTIGLALSQNKSLTELKLKSNGLKSDGVEAILQPLSRKLSGGAPLVRLDLSFNQVGAEGSRALSDLLSRPTCLIQSLSLASCSLTNESLSALAGALAESSKLNFLDLSSNSFTNNAGSEFFQLLRTKKSSISELNLRGNKLGVPVSDELGKYLKETKSLTTLDFGLNELDVKAIAIVVQSNSSLKTLHLTIPDTQSVSFTERGWTKVATSFYRK